MKRGRPFPPGVSGNPNGRPKVPEEIKMARALNKLELERILNEFIYMTPDEMTTKIESGSATAIEAMVGAIILAAVKHGDQARLNFILDRLIGKVKEAIDISGQITLEKLVAGTKDIESE
jgi:hypothetical protein